MCVARFWYGDSSVRLPDRWIGIVWSAPASYGSISRDRGLTRRLAVESSPRVFVHQGLGDGERFSCLAPLPGFETMGRLGLSGVACLIRIVRAIAGGLQSFGFQGGKRARASSLSSIPAAPTAHHMAEDADMPRFPLYRRVRAFNSLASGGQGPPVLALAGGGEGSVPVVAADP